MKRFLACLLFILVISFCVSFFVKAEEKDVTPIEIEEVNITSTIRIDNAITKLNFFKKNINVIVTYK